MLRHPIIAGCAALALIAFALPAAEAQTRTIRTIVPFGPGGATDAVARVLAAHIERTQKVSTVIENRPGAGSIIATDAVARMAGDGNTLLIVATSFLTNPMLRKVNYDPMADFTPICHLVSTPAVITVSASSPYKTLDDLIKAAKAQPGKLSLGTPGPGSSHHILFEGFKQRAKVDITYVPFQATSKAISAALGDHLTAVLSDYGSLAGPLESGQLRALAVSSPERMKAMPDVPTLEEAGLPGLGLQSWFGIVAPAKLGGGIADELIGWYRAALADKDATAKLRALQLEPTPICGAEFETFLRTTGETFETIIKSANIKMK